MGRYRGLAAGLAIVVGIWTLVAFADQELVQDNPVTILPGHSLPIDCETVLIDRLAETPPLVDCATPTPEPPTPTPTDTPTPTATSTATPTATPVPTIEGVPLCLDHDPIKWHPLVKRDAAGVITCTFGHSHYDDPKTLDGIFGPVAAWWGGNQEISYPWQTFSTAGVENAVKHRVYKWETIDDPACKGNPAGGNGLSFDKIRIQAHLDPISELRRRQIPTRSPIEFQRSGGRR